MIYLLDTNTCIAFLTGRSSGVVERLRATEPADVAICAVVKAELLYGAHKSARAEENLRALERFFAPLESLPFDDAAAEEAGRVRAALERGGTPVGPNDLLIAATALASERVLVTHNTREFSRIAGLAVEDWELEG